MSLDLRGNYAGYFCFPRVSGDEPLSRQFSVYRYGFSPRERG